MKILLIEPDSILGATYVAALQRAGHQTMLERGAQNAIHAADDSRPDMVILELQLPGHSGVEFLYEFWSYPEWQHIPVILHTFVPEHSLALPPTIKPVQYLYKPATSLEQLVQAVGRTVPVA